MDRDVSSDHLALVLGTVVLTLPADARPVHKHTFAVNVHSTGADLFIRVDVLPNGNVVVRASFACCLKSVILLACMQAQQGFARYVAIDGISFETTNSSDWEPLLDTLPAVQQAVFTPAPGFAPPSYKVPLPPSL